MFDSIQWFLTLLIQGPHWESKQGYGTLPREMHICIFTRCFEYQYLFSKALGLIRKTEAAWLITNNRSHQLSPCQFTWNYWIRSFGVSKIHNFTKFRYCFWWSYLDPPWLIGETKALESHKWVKNQNFILMNKDKSLKLSEP